MRIRKLVINSRLNGPLLAAAFLAGCVLALFTSHATAEPGNGLSLAFAKRTGEAKPALSLEKLEKKIHNLINRERRKQGLNPLEWNPALGRIARLHSRDMASRNFFDHRNPEGRTFRDRYRQGNYSCRIEAGIGTYSLGGENIFQNNLYRSITTIKSAGSVRTVYSWNSLDEIARSTVDGWMKSPGHRKNILQPFWKTEGIGIAISSDDKVLITQNFC